MSDRGQCSKKRSQSSAVAFLCQGAWLGSILGALAVLSSCTPKKMNVGVWECPAARDADGGAAGAPDKGAPVTVPWSTGFEDGFCDYPSLDGAGYCYGDEPYLLVTEPRRPGGGNLVAEFKVIGGGWNQTRCVRQGAFPESAYYGAYYFIPEALQNAQEDWNLFHFQGGQVDDMTLKGFWDVSLTEIGDSGEWQLVVKDPLAQPGTLLVYGADAPKPVPIGKWFHIELFLKRAADATGKVTLYQDGEKLLDKSNLKSNASPFTQWYVGDWAANATPADSSLYVDDITISANPTIATP
ncbi:MAG TPA: heparin lyase I family protein [Polyangiaceae bacterium]|nr:heparin lyase I family protein [Polyangiaceae bacterium]